MDTNLDVYALWNISSQNRTGKIAIFLEWLWDYLNVMDESSIEKFEENERFLAERLYLAKYS